MFSSLSQCFLAEVCSCLARFIHRRRHLQLVWYIWLIITSKEEESHTCLVFFVLYEVFLQLIKQSDISTLFEPPPNAQRWVELVEV